MKRSVESTLLIALSFLIPFQSNASAEVIIPSVLECSDAMTSDAFTLKITNADLKANPCYGSKEESCRMANALGLFKQYDKAEVIMRTTGKSCGEAKLDSSGRVDELNFYKCFFGASDLEFQPFAQAVVNNYSIGSLSCKSDLDNPLVKQYAREGVGPSDPRTCVGIAKTREKVTISTGGILKPEVIVQKANERPAFN